MGKNNMSLKIGIMACALLGWGFSCVLQAQAPEADRQGNRPPQPPILAALDLDQDNILNADEIANAASALKSLDKNDDGQLSADECRPARPSGGGGPEGSAGTRGDAPPAGAAGPGMAGMQPPKAPLDSALDTDGDGIIAADEIVNAAVALRQLDKNGDGRLTMDECMPGRPGSGK
jgi:hypothetical protein